ncbi:uncharacterized protein LOC120339376 [Styela clava]
MFSSDVVAFEAQSAPLWENVNKGDEEFQSRKRESVNQKQSQKRRNGSPSHYMQWDTKRPRIMLQFTECKLCELKFKSELELEEHLFSILHHRALNTEKGECKHECNLCGVTCKNLTDYVAHLTSDSHKEKTNERKEAINNGHYSHPKNNLRKYTSTFMCLPRKAKQMQLSEEMKKNPKPTVSPRDPRPQFKNYEREDFHFNQRPNNEHHNFGRDQRPRPPYHWQDNDYRYGRQYHPNNFPQWHSMGRYGGCDRRPYPNVPDYDHRNYDDSNPYNHGWIDRLPRNMNSWQRQEFDKNTRNIQRLNKSIESLPKSSAHYRSPRNNNDHHSRSLTSDQARTKQLVARAHQVIQNGKSSSQPAPKKLNVSSSNKKQSEKQQNKTQSNNQTLNRSNSSSSSCKSKTSLTSTEKKQSAKKMKRVGSLDPDLSKVNDKKLSVNLQKLKKWQCRKRAVSLDKIVNSEMINKFRDQIDTQALNVGKNGIKTNEKANNEKGSKNNIVSKNDSSNKNDKNVTKQPGTSENIRAEFRKILDEIDQPVASASEIIQNAEKLDNGNGKVDDCYYFSDTPTSSSIDLSEQQTTQNDTLYSSVYTQGTEGFTPDTTQYTSLPELKDNSDLNSVKVSADLTSEKSSNLTPNSDTPVRDVIQVASDVDTPNTKNRIHPQPNINKARSRLCSKQKESPDIPPEGRQAKLKKLLQKYDRTKKNSPDVGNSAGKKIAGPRFGINLHLRSESTENSEMESIAKAIELVELFPEKRTRSLSENDSTLSFATAGTNSATNIISDENIQRQNLTPNGKSSQTIQQQQQQPNNASICQTGASTPVVPDPMSQSFNSKLLSMSEREETLHASVRSLAVQEANVQSEIERKVEALRLFYAEVEKLKERKMCIDALKRKNEQELESLRQERLMLLRGTVNGNASQENSTTEGSIFQEVIPNCRRSSFNGSSFTHSTPIPDMQNSSAEISSFATNVNSGHVNNATAQLISGRAAFQPPDSGPFLPIHQDQIRPTITSPPKHTAFDIRNVKSEPTQKDLPFVQVPFPRSKGQGSEQGNEHTEINIKQETDNQQSSNSFNQSKSLSSESSLRCDGNRELSREADSTQFYSICNDTLNNTTLSATSAEVDRILSKYTRQKTDSNSSDQNLNSPQKQNSRMKNKRKKLQPRIGMRRSPRNLSKSSPQQQTSSNEINGNEQPQEISEDIITNDVIPKTMKAHNLPLVGMHLVDEGLVTCSLDETVTLHRTGGRRISENLGATPTAMTATSDDRSVVIFVATQKMICTKNNNDDSQVINKMEHHLSIYTTTVPQKHSFNRESSYILMHRIPIKTRVLCLHYDKNYLFCGMRDGMTAIVSLNMNYKPDDDVNVLECHSCSAITCLTTGREGPRRILCSGSTDCTVSVRDATDGLLLRTIQGHMKTVTCLQLVHNELFSASVDRKVLGHDLITGNLLHRFSGHVGVVRSLSVFSGKLVTLCSDRNIRFFDIKTSRLLQTPTSIPSLPLFSCLQINKDLTSSDKCSVIIGCEDSTVIRLPFPTNGKPSIDLSTESPIRKSPAKNTVNLTGDYECRWAGCVGAGTFSDIGSLQKHVFSVHVNPHDLTEYALDRSTATLSFGTCCQWESCTHYFAPELDTMTDVHSHVQRHFNKKGNRTTTDKSSKMVLSDLEARESVL